MRYALPNGGFTDIKSAARMAAEGRKRHQVSASGGARLTRTSQESSDRNRPAIQGFIKLGIRTAVSFQVKSPCRLNTAVSMSSFESGSTRAAWKVSRPS